MLKKINRRRKLIKKYKRKYSWDEDLTHFAIKAVGSVALFFMIAIGMDAYHFFHY